MKKTKKFPIAITRLINEVNELLPMVNNCNDYAGSYAGSTHYSYIMLDNEIRVKNNFVYIDTTNFSNNYPFEKRYNVNNIECDIKGLPALKYDLRLIIKAFKQCIKNN